MSDPEKTEVDQETTLGGSGRAVGTEFPASAWDKYKFVALLGEGGMGVVYKAFDPRLNRYVALKFLRDDSPMLRTRFVNEGRSQAQIEHPNVCKVYEVGEVEGKAYIAMQYIDGISLAAAGSIMTLEQKVRALKEVADGIHSAHRIGLIHRDLKPGNIMLEKTEQGWHPYVLDFGLAREINSAGITMTGMFVGTPHYVAPEQAWGGSGALDRRADIYSLGATFYELLAGAPPLTGETTLVVLQKLLEEEPRPLRQIATTVPADVETIVMKCLEKDPQRRYESARALADDLQRWLDGDAIFARRSSLIYRMSKKARKHRAVVAVASVGLVCVLALGAFSARTALRARQRAELAQQFGQQVQRIETIMRLSRMSPLHDTSPQKQIVERRMQEIASLMNQLGDIAQAPGHYALGRGYLSLNDFPKSREHLQQAWDLGYHDKDTAYALGLALGHLFQQELDAAEMIGNKDERQASIRRLERKYRDPAIRLLAQSAGIEETAPAYVEGLIDFYQSRFQEAEARAEEALSQVPWLYEARILQGRIYMRAGQEKENTGDYASARQDYRQSIQAYETALKTGPSDTEAYEGLCGLYSQWIHMELFQTGGEISPLQEGATSSCERALQADPRNTNALITLSNMNSYLARSAMDNGRDPMPFLQKARDSAQQAVRAKPSERAFNILAVAWRFQAEYELYHGEDPRPSIQRLIENQDAAVRLNPQDSKSFENRGSAYMIQAEYEMDHGIDPRPSLRQSILSFQQCVDLKSNSYSCFNSLANAFATRSDFEIEHGIDPASSFDGARKAYEAALRLNPNYTHVYNNLGTLYEAQGRWDLSTGKDPGPAFAQALKLYDRTIELNPNYQHPYSNKAVSYLYLAQYEQSQGRTPEAAVEDGLKNSDHALKINDTEAIDWTIRAGLLLERARYEAAQGRSPLKTLAEGRDVLRKAQSLDDAFSDVARLQGASFRIEADWLLRTGKSGDASLKTAQDFLQKAVLINALDDPSAVQLADVMRLRAAKSRDPKLTEEALALLNRVLAQNPRSADAMAVRGLLLQLQGNESEGLDSIRQALRINPSLARAYNLNPR